MKREELMRQRMRTMKNRQQEYSNKMKKTILKAAVRSSKKLVKQADLLNQSLKHMNAKLAMKKKILELESHDATMATAKEQLEIQLLKDQYYKLAAMKERQKMQMKATQELLKHNTMMSDLEEVDNKAKLAFNRGVLARKGLNKQLVADVKENAAEALKAFKAKLNKEYELKKKVLHLKRCLRTRLAMNSSIKKQQLEAKLEEMVKKAVIARIKAERASSCIGNTELTQKMLK